MKFGDQQRVFRLIPGLERAEFLRYGQVHRNTYINSPRILLPTLQTRRDTRILFAGQISGVEGYLESIATGLVAGINAARLVRGLEPLTFPASTACGSLARYVSMADADRFQPVNATFGLLPPLSVMDRCRVREKRKRHLLQVESALTDMRQFLGLHPEAFC
jgi:methylenetetrahydrofolate--tRNA-(uracil-5-)-methyltransferase